MLLLVLRNASSTNPSLTAETGARAFVGQAAGTRVARVISGAAGSFATSTPAAPVVRGYRITGQVGALAETGLAAGTRASRAMVAASRAFIETGVSAPLVKGRTLPAAAGAFAETGLAVGLRAARNLAAGVGALSETGVAANVTRSRVMPANAGAFAETGIAAGVRASRRMVASAGAAVETGVPVLVRATRRMVASPSAIVEAGSASLLIGTRRLTVSGAALTVSGLAINLTRGRTMPADVGGLVGSGADAGSQLTRRLIASVGVVEVLGMDARTLRDVRFTIEAASFVETGLAAPCTHEEVSGDRHLYALLGSIVVVGRAANMQYVQRLPSNEAAPFIALNRPAYWSEVRKRATDVAVFPWRREDQHRWTTPAFRAIVLDWLRRWIASRPWVSTWKVREIAYTVKSQARLNRLRLILEVTRKSDSRAFEVACEFAQDDVMRSAAEIEAVLNAGAALIDGAQ